MLLRALLLAALSPAAALRAAAPTLSRPAPRRAAAIGMQLAASDIGCGSAEWLSRNVESDDLAVVLETLLTSCAQVASKVRTASCDSTACFSPLMEEGDEVAVDVLANELLVAGLRATGRVGHVSSELDGIDQTWKNSGFAVAVDPLSGSSIIDTNFAVGTIFGIWGGGSLADVTGRELLAAGVCVYGPRTTFTLALAEREATHEFLLVDEAVGGSPGRWAKSNAFAEMREGKLFAPANLRCSAEHAGYAKLLEHWRLGGYTLRYTGAAVVDVLQLLVKGFGVFVSPATVGKRAQLRLLYEAMPLAFLVEKAGGASSNGERSLLDVSVRNTDHRTQVALGSPEEVRRFEEMVGPSPVQGWLGVSARDALRGALGIGEQ